MSDGSSQSTSALFEHLEAVERLIRENEAAKIAFLHVNEAEHVRLSTDLYETQRALKVRLGARLGPDDPSPPKIVFPPVPVPVERNYRDRSAPPACMSVEEHVVVNTKTGGLHNRSATGHAHGSGISLERQQRLLALLQTGPASALDLHAATGFAHSPISVFLRAQVDKGILVKERRGKTIVYLTAPKV